MTRGRQEEGARMNRVAESIEESTLRATELESERREESAQREKEERGQTGTPEDNSDRGLLREQEKDDDDDLCVCACVLVCLDDALP